MTTLLLTTFAIIGFIAICVLVHYQQQKKHQQRAEARKSMESRHKRQGKASNSRSLNNAAQSSSNNDVLLHTHIATDSYSSCSGGSYSDSGSSSSSCD